MGYGSFYPYTWEAADKFLGKKQNRPVANNTRCIRLSDGSIGIKLHNTVVVRYMQDGNIVLDSGGWRTVTTGDRIRHFSPARIYSDGKNGWGVWHDSDKRTPSKITKCRKCKGTGQYQVTVPTFTVNGQEYRYWIPWGSGTDEERAAAVSNVVDVVETHGCYNCNSTGQRERGDNPIPTPFHDGIVVDATGKVVKGASYSYAAAPSATQTWLDTIQPKVDSPAPDPYMFGQGETLDVIAKVIPAVGENVRHPITAKMEALSSVVVDLNDSHSWTREQIADWLETLDLDLRFPAPVD